MTIQQETRAPFAAHTQTSDKRRAGRTLGPNTQVEIRAWDVEIDAGLRAWVYERLGRQLGKFAPQIERINVRFGDDNGTKGGIDQCCMVHVILSKLPPVVVEMRGGTDREAFDLAAKSVERAVQRNIEKHGFSTRHGKNGRKGHAKRTNGHAAEAPAVDAQAMDGASDGQVDGEMDGQQLDGDFTEDSWFGRRVGHGRDALMMLAVRPEKVRRDAQVDTSAPDSGADDRKIGYGHTATRNVKLNTAGMSRALEDSTTDRPSRKSTRGGTNRIKPDNPLTRRTKSAVLSPKSVAGRAASRGH